MALCNYGKENSMKKITKSDINKLAGKVFRWASSNRCGHDFGIYYNGKCREWYYDITQHKYVKRTRENINPLDYCEYFSPKFVMGMWYDGEMYDVMNGCGRRFEKLEKLLEQYGLYCEHCDGCHAEFVPIDDVEDFEYTNFYKEKPVRLYRPDDAPDKIADIMRKYHELSEAVGDVGACTIGEYIEFRYNKILYRMSPQTPYQGDISWRTPLPEVREMLIDIGATEIHVNYGRLD